MKALSFLLIVSLTASMTALTKEEFQSLMAQMISQQNKDIQKDIVDKLDVVKTELSTAIQGISKRQDKLESEQSEIRAEQSSIRDQVSSLSRKLDKMQNSSTPVDPKSSAQGKSPLPDCTEQEKDKALELLETARKTVSLYPFNQSDIDFELKRGAKDINEAKLWAVQTYLRCEMNIRSHILQTFTIENIFPPKSQGTIRHIQ